MTRVEREHLRNAIIYLGNARLEMSLASVDLGAPRALLDADVLTRHAQDDLDRYFEAQIRREEALTPKGGE